MGTLSDENAKRVGIDPRGLHEGSGGGSGGSKIIDLGMVNYRDAAIKGRENILIPYADGRLIKSVSFVPGGAADSQYVLYFMTPNTIAQAGYAAVPNDAFATTQDTMGLLYGGSAVGMDGNAGHKAMIIDTTPLFPLLYDTTNSSYVWDVGSWQANTKVCQTDRILDDAGHIQIVTTNGVTGSSKPTFDDAGGTTSDGTAQWTDWGLPPTGQVHAIAEVIEGASPVPLYPVTIEWVIPPADAVAGSPIPDFTVMVKDQNGDPYKFASLALDAAIFGAGTFGDSGFASVSSTDTATGIATFTGVVIVEAGTGYVLRCRFSYGPIGPIYSPPFDVTAP